MNQKNSLKLNKCFLDTEDPFELFENWFEEAKKNEINDHNALALATVNKKSEPSFRMGLLKDFDKQIEFVTGDVWKAGNLSYHLESRPKWVGLTNDKILNDSSQFICIDDICLGRY